MRYDMGPEVWLSDRGLALIWDNGHLCEYTRTGPDAEPWVLSAWLPSEKGWRWGRPPEAIRARWNRLAGWPEGAVDSVGPWSLQPNYEGWSATLAGPGPALPEANWLPFDPVARRWEEDEEDLRPPLRSLSIHARLCPGPHGAVLVDPDRALVWSLTDGLAWRLEGVNEEWGLQALRLPGAILVHAACQHRSGMLVKLHDDGRLESLGDPYGFTCPLRLHRGRVHAPLPIEGVLADGPSGHGLFVFAPDARAFPDPVTVLDYGPWASELREGLWVVNDGHRAVILRESDAGWVEEQILRPPTGDPTRLHGPTRLAEGPPLQWRGRPGAFTLELRLENEGRDQVGFVLQAAGEAARLQLARLGEQEARFVSGAARFDHAPLRHREPLTLRLEGEVTAPGLLTLQVHTTSFAPVDPNKPRHEVQTERIGGFRVQLEVEGGLLLRRGEACLALDPSWVAALGVAGLLDTELREPELERWWTRAMRRCRAEARTPEVVQAWLALSQREREAASPSGVAAYKLRSGQRWVLSEAEAARIAQALGPEHALGAWASGGAFEVSEG